jgi:hypothetical protein
MPAVVIAVCLCTSRGWAQTARWPEYFKHQVSWLKKCNRPVICTEYMARSVGSTFDTLLPIAKEEQVGGINWGFVAGKTQTYLPWESWEHPYVLSQPPVWFHEVLRPDGTPLPAGRSGFDPAADREAVGIQNYGARD